MLRQLFLFEWRYHIHKLLFVFISLLFLLFGFIFTIGGYLPGVNLNSPYFINYTLGILSMGGLFPVVIFASNAMLRDPDNLMQEMVYATPVSKWHFLSSRFLGVLVASICSFSFAIIGMIAGSFYPSIDPEILGPFHVSYYAWPWLIQAIPNIFFATSLVFLLASLTKNRMATYLGGLLLYVLYILGSMFANAPWLAGVSPASAEAIALSAKLDPFGLSAFFEQSQYLTSGERNAQLLSFSGNFFLNRVLWLGISCLCIVGTYVGFSFRTASRRRKKISKAREQAIPRTSYSPVPTAPFSNTAQFQSLFSHIRLEFKAILKSLPFLIAMAIWTLLIGSETWSSILGGTRMPDDYPLTGMLLSNLLVVIPFFGILLVIFYSNEQIWRGRLLKMDELNNSAPVSNWVIYVSKLLVLLLVPICMIAIGIAASVLVQISRGFWEIDGVLYLSAFYYAGLPLFCVSILALFIQSLFKRRYLGMLITVLLILGSSSRISALIGLNHPLFKFAKPLFETSYSELNGFGIYGQAFHWRMAYWSSFALLFALVSYAIWNRSKESELKERFQYLVRKLGRTGISLLVLSSVLFVGTGTYIFYKTNVEEPYYRRELQNDWSQEYEEKYKQYENKTQPIPTRIYAEVDLFPHKNRYEVRANYVIENKSDQPIQDILIGLSKESQLQSLEVKGAKIQEKDETFGQYQFHFTSALKPGENTEVKVSFFSEWNGFNPHAAFNSIVENGSFIRMSRYFPFFGYNDTYELSNEDVRRERGLPARISSLKKLTDQPGDSSHYEYEYEYIDFESIVSTSSDQRAIGSGKLLKSWTEGDRNYFHYKMDRQIPNRFAFATGRYAVERIEHEGVTVEVYYHPDHSYNIDLLLKASRQTLDYCTEAFGPYQYDRVRFVEVSDFTSGFAATAYPNTLFMRESMGFMADMRKEGEIDILNQLVAHELGHQWWSGQVDPEHREGGILLTETLAQYTEFMIYEKAYGKQAALNALNVEMDLYFRNRSFDEEVPLIRAGNTHPHIPYSKGAHVMYSIKEMIGEKKLNEALQKLIADYAFPQRPPTSEDLLREILNVADATWEQEIRDMFEKILIYDLKMLDAQAEKEETGTYEVRLRIVAQKNESDSVGKQRPIPLNDSLQVAIFKNDQNLTDPENILYLKRHRITQDTTVLKLRIKEKPGAAGIDPFLLSIDMDKTNNVKEIEVENER